MKLTIRIALSALVLLPIGVAAAHAEDEAQGSSLLDTVSSADLKRLTGLLEDYLSEPLDSTKRIDAREKFEKEVEKQEESYKIPGKYLTDLTFLGKLFTDASTYSHERARIRGRISEDEVKETISGREWKVPYAIWIPKEYRDEDPWPTIIGLHPQGKDGKWYLEQVLTSDSLRDNYIIICPTLAEGERFDQEVGFIKLLGLVLNRVSRTYFVDKDRIFLDGYADGGESAWNLACSFRDLFAGIVTRSAGLDSALVEGNMRHVPAIAFVGSDDEAVKLEPMRKTIGTLAQDKYPLTLKEVAGVGQSTFTDQNDAVAEWLKDKHRALFPAQVSMAARKLAFGRTYWVNVTRIETATDPETNQPLLASLKATYDRAANKIDITSENVYRLEIFLNDDIVDLDQPFVVNVNGEKMWDGKKDRSWRYLVDRYIVSADPTRLFTASIQLDVR